LVCITSGRADSSLFVPFSFAKNRVDDADNGHIVSLRFYRIAFCYYNTTSASKFGTICLHHPLKDEMALVWMIVPPCTTLQVTTGSK